MSNGNPKPVLLAMACNPYEGYNPADFDTVLDVNILNEVQLDSVVPTDTSPDLDATILTDAVDTFVDAVADALMQDVVKDVSVFPDFFNPDVIKDEMSAPDIPDAQIPEISLPDIFVPDAYDAGIDIFITPDESTVPDLPQPQDIIVTETGIDTGSDVNNCNQVVSVEAKCNGVDDDCDGETDEGCWWDVPGNCLVLSPTGLSVNSFIDFLISDSPPMFIGTTILFNGSAADGVKVCEVPQEIAELIIPNPCTEGQGAPLGLAESLVYAGSPFSGRNEWHLVVDGIHLATLQADANTDAFGLIFGPNAPLDKAACEYLYNNFVY